MLIWSGYGIVVAILTFINLLLAELISEHQTGDDSFYQNNLFPMGIAFLVSALMINMLWRYMQYRREQQKRISFPDRLMSQGKTHSLFFIPVKYWPYITAALGIGVMVWQLIR